MGRQRIPAGLAQARVTQLLAGQAQPARLRRQQTTAEGPIRGTGQLELARSQVQAHLPAREQVELLIGKNDLESVQGPGTTRHWQLRKGRAP